MPYIADLKSRPVAEVALSATELAIFIACNVAFYRAFGGQAWFWLLEAPKRAAILLLAWSFDYVPHRPHTHARVGTDVVGCTSKVGGVFSSPGTGDAPPALDKVLLYQTYHNVHHLFPTVPFYRYAAIWRRHRDELLAAGTPVASVVDATRPWI